MPGTVPGGRVRGHLTGCAPGNNVERAEPRAPHATLIRLGGKNVERAEPTAPHATLIPRLAVRTCREPSLSNQMRASKRQMAASGEGEGLIAWRIERLREAGFPGSLANSVARDARYDLHELLGLTDRGCPAELAARILAPIDSERAAALGGGSFAPLDSGPHPPRPC
jgi:hypothetical protein